MVFSSVNVFIALYDQCFCANKFVPWVADDYRDPYICTEPSGGSLDRVVATPLFLF